MLMSNNHSTEAEVKGEREDDDEYLWRKAEEEAETLDFDKGAQFLESIIAETGNGGGDYYGARMIHSIPEVNDDDESREVREREREGHGHTDDNNNTDSGVTGEERGVTSSLSLDYSDTHLLEQTFKECAGIPHSQVVLTHQESHFYVYSLIPYPPAIRNYNNTNSNPRDMNTDHSMCVCCTGSTLDQARFALWNGVFNRQRLAAIEQSKAPQSFWQKVFSFMNNNNHRQPRKQTRGVRVGSPAGMYGDGRLPECARRSAHLPHLPHLPHLHHRDLRVEPVRYTPASAHTDNYGASQHTAIPVHSHTPLYEENGAYHTYTHTCSPSHRTHLQSAHHSEHTQHSASRHSSAHHNNNIITTERYRYHPHAHIYSHQAAPQPRDKRGDLKTGAPDRSKLRHTHAHKPKLSSVSFAELLVPTAYRYDPLYFDNPRYRQGKHHMLMDLDGYRCSIIPFVNRKRLKEQLNDQFRNTHPWVEESITLSKLRNLKRDVFSFVETIPELDLSTIASSWVYFERLIMKGVVHKATRKVLAGVCVLLAYKFHQSTDCASQLGPLCQAVQRLDRTENLSASEVFKAEFAVFAMLDFSLQAELDHVLPHINQYLEEKRIPFDEIYGKWEEQVKYEQ